MLQRNVHMRAEHGAGAQHIQAARVQLARFQRTDAQPGAPGKFGRKGCIQSLEQMPEVAGMRIAAILAQVDARNHDFRMPGGQQATGLGHNVRHRAAAVRPSGQGDDAVGAAVRTAVLHLEHGTSPFEGGDAKGGKVRFGGIAGKIRPGAAQQCVLFFLGHKNIRYGPYSSAARHIAGEQARRAAGEDDAGCGGFAAQPENRVARIALAFCRDGATVDADDVRPGRIFAFLPALRAPGFAQGLGFVLIDLAPEGDQKKFPAGHALCPLPRPTPQKAFPGLRGSGISRCPDRE